MGGRALVGWARRRAGGEGAGWRQAGAQAVGRAGSQAVGRRWSGGRAAAVGRSGGQLGGGRLGGRAGGRSGERALLFRSISFESFSVNPFFFHAALLYESPRRKLG